MAEDVVKMKASLTMNPNKVKAWVAAAVKTKIKLLKKSPKSRNCATSAKYQGIELKIALILTIENQQNKLRNLKAKKKHIKNQRKKNLVVRKLSNERLLAKPSSRSIGFSFKNWRLKIL